MILTHNYYVDFLKSLNSFLLKVFNQGNVRSSQAIQKIEYSFGSKTILQHNLYNNESFEYPNIMVNLNDIRIDEGVSSLSRNVYGNLESIHTQFAAENVAKNDTIYVETKRYLLNFDIQVNVETNGDLLNYYHVCTNNLPINYTFVDFSFLYFINISDYARALDWSPQDELINVLLFNQGEEKDSPDISLKEDMYYSLLEIQPELEVQSITKTEDKENMKYSLNINFLASLNIPYIIYSTSRSIIERIIIDVDLGKNIDKTQDYPILLDIDKQTFVDKNIQGGYSIQENHILFVTKNWEEPAHVLIKLDDVGNNIVNSSFALYFIDNYYDYESKRLFVPVNLETNKEIYYDEGSQSYYLKLYDSYYTMIKEFFETKQYNSELNQFFILKVQETSETQVPQVPQVPQEIQFY